MAIAELKGSGEVSGTVVFFQPRPPDGTVFVTGNITGLPKGLHGFHIHRDGDLRNNCDSMGPHYNPFLVSIDVFKFNMVVPLGKLFHSQKNTAFATRFRCMA